MSADPEKQPEDPEVLESEELSEEEISTTLCPDRVWVVHHQNRTLNPEPMSPSLSLVDWAEKTEPSPEPIQVTQNLGSML
jgi:hypothetical protein